MTRFNVSEYMANERIRQAHSDTVAMLANERLTVQEFINRAAAIHPKLCDAVSGIYCGKEGQAYGDYDTDHMLVMQWHYGKMEVAYIS